MTDQHPAFDEAVAEVRRRKGIVYPPPEPEPEPDEDEDAIAAAECEVTP